MHFINFDDFIHHLAPKKQKLPQVFFPERNINEVKIAKVFINKNTLVNKLHIALMYGRFPVINSFN